MIERGKDGDANASSDDSRKPSLEAYFTDLAPIKTN